MRIVKGEWNDFDDLFLIERIHERKKAGVQAILGSFVRGLEVCTSPNNPLPEQRAVLLIKCLMPIIANINLR